MSYADATLSQERIQPRRIAATSVAIAIHIAVLMMLMMPASVPSVVTEETTTTIDFIEAKPKQPDPIPIVREKPKPQLAPRKADIPVKEEQIVDTEAPTAMSTKAEEQPELPPTSFNTTVEPASTFVELAVSAGPPPVYPRMAIQRHIQGTVMLRVHVDANGKPMEVSIEQSSGSSILDEAARKFVQARWLFVPAQQNGQATDAWGLVPVQFVLQ